MDTTIIFAALEKWIKAHPKLDIHNYGFDANGRKSYSDELRGIAKQRREALVALAEARQMTPRVELLIESFGRAYSGRLSWEPVYSQCKFCGHRPDVDKSMPCEKSRTHKMEPIFHLAYTTGQYYPTEYRQAAGAVLRQYVNDSKRADNAERPRVFRYETMEDVKAANSAIGSYFFSRDTMRCFRSKIESGIVKTGWTPEGPTKARFITSESGPASEGRRYTIREAQPDGSISTVGEFQQYGTRRAAKAALLNYPEAACA